MAKVPVHIINLFVALLLVINSLAIYNFFDTPPLYDPFGDFPTQQVQSRVDGFDGPAVLITDELVVIGEKCYNEDIVVSSSFDWYLTKPAGTIIRGGGSVSTPKDKGCLKQRYSNPIPPAVVTRVTDLADDGQFVSVWRLQGRECPNVEEDVRPVCKNWASEQFDIVVQRKK